MYAHASLGPSQAALDVVVRGTRFAVLVEATKLAIEHAQLARGATVGCDRLWARLHAYVASRPIRDRLIDLCDGPHQQRRRRTDAPQARIGPQP
jgi:hypothetical protein